MKNKMENFDGILKEVMNRIQATESLNYFVERSLPILTHFQICEALNTVLKKQNEDLFDFENLKIEEISKFQIKYKGVPPNVKMLNTRLRQYATYYSG